MSTITFDPAAIRQVDSAKTGLTSLRTFEFSPLYENGERVKTNAKGVSTIVLTADETAAFRALGVEALTAMVVNGTIVLPGTGGRGKPTATGVSLAALLGIDLDATDDESDDDDESTDDESDDESDDDDGSPESDDEAEEAPKARKARK